MSLPDIYHQKLRAIRHIDVCRTEAVPGPVLISQSVNFGFAPPAKQTFQTLADAAVQSRCHQFSCSELRSQSTGLWFQMSGVRIPSATLPTRRNHRFLRVFCWDLAACLLDFTSCFFVTDCHKLSGCVCGWLTSGTARI